MQKILYNLTIGGQLIGLVIEGDDDFLYGIYFAHEMKGAVPSKENVSGNKNISAAAEFLDLYSNGALSARPSAVKITRISGIPCLDISYKKEKISIRLNLAGCTDKTIAVYASLMNVPSGKTISYGALAGISGLSRAARFAGSAMAANIFPVIIPCHRVVRSDGSMGRYSGGDSIKPLLLSHESACRM